MKNFQGQNLDWSLANGVVELTLHSQPCNEIGTAMLAEMEQFVAAPAVALAARPASTAAKSRVRMLQTSENWPVLSPSTS